MYATQLAAELAAKYCYAMSAYELREAALNLLPRAMLENKVRDISEGDEEHANNVIAQGKEGMIATLLEFELGNQIAEVTKPLEIINVDVKQLELVRKFGAAYPLVAPEWFYSFLVMPNDENPAEELGKIFEAGTLVKIDKEETENEAGHTYIEWHLDTMRVTDLIRIIKHFNLSFESCDNSDYNDAENCELGDLSYINKDMVQLVIFEMSTFGPKFSVWAPQLKALIEKNI